MPNNIEVLAPASSVTFRYKHAATRCSLQYGKQCISLNVRQNTNPKSCRIGTLVQRNVGTTSVYNSVPFTVCVVSNAVPNRDNLMGVSLRNLLMKSALIDYCRSCTNSSVSLRRSTIARRRLRSAGGLSLLRSCYSSSQRKSARPKIDNAKLESQLVGIEDERCRRLRQIPGFGPLISTAMVAAIGNGAAFRRGRDLAAWVGVVPRQYSTGGKQKLFGMSKRGNIYLRRLLVHGARAVLFRIKYDTGGLGQWVHRLLTMSIGCRI
jgi:Transposase IS116/IS110/IS902 family